MCKKRQLLLVAAQSIESFDLKRNLTDSPPGQSLTSLPLRLVRSP